MIFDFFIDFVSISFRFFRLSFFIASCSLRCVYSWNMSLCLKVNKIFCRLASNFVLLVYRFWILKGEITEFEKIEECLKILKIWFFRFSKKSFFLSNKDIRLCVLRELVMIQNDVSFRSLSFYMYIKLASKENISAA